METPTAAQKHREHTIVHVFCVFVSVCWVFFPPQVSAAKARKETAALRPSAAAVALFVNSDLDGARTLAAQTLRRNARDPDALFVTMEAAALAADTEGELDAALRLLEATVTTGDPRAAIGAARILDLSGNTLEFRAVVPRIQQLIAADHAQTSFLQAALIAAATEGAPGLHAFDLARQSGLITDWRIVGPLGEYPNVAFDRRLAPERDALARKQYDGRFAEEFRFDDGNVTLRDYMAPTGVFYAAAQVPVATGGAFRLRVESAGTLQIEVNGAIVLRKDDRFRDTPEMAWSTLRLMAGTHRVLVKFLPSAVPFRIAMLPQHGHEAAPGPPISGPEEAYVRAAEKYWAGDYAAAITLLSELHKRQPSASADLLLAQAWSHTDDGSPESAVLLQSALERAPLALAAEYGLADRALDAGHVEEAFHRARRVAEARPGNVLAQHLVAQAAQQLHWTAEAGPAIEAELRLYPTCGAMQRAARFFRSIAAYERARQLESELDGCAPGSLAFAEALRDAGRHQEAADAADKIVAERPFDRAAREFQVRELALAGRSEDARQAAAELVMIAPNSAAFRKLADDVARGAEVFDADSLRTREFAGNREFYAPYRRDGLEIIRKTAHRTFSGGPAVLLLHDRVVRLAPDGSVSLYVHKITRVLGRDGIEKYGEITLPHSADLLELRTIKQDGTIAEPEFNQHKSSISMPALAPGDAVEQEYVLHYPDDGGDHAEAFSYTFGSFAAPILYARFVALASVNHELQIISSNGAPAATVTTAAGEIVRAWERENISQSTEETAAPPPATLLPSVQLAPRRPGGWQDLRDFYRNELLGAVRAGTRVEAAASRLRGATDEETARRLYGMVTTRLHSADGGFESGALASAESTLAGRSGSRTNALLALAHAAGLEAELLLTRSVTTSRPSAPERGVYTHPLVLFRLSQDGRRREVAVDAETDGVGFGVLPPTIAHEDALAVPLTEAAAGQAIVSVPASAGDELSVANGDVTFDLQGNLAARITIRMGAARGAEMRAILRGIEPGERGHFFEQLAMRIFPGATDATGQIGDERDAEHNLELLLTCRAPHVLTFNGGSADLEQLAPALGLRKMYGLGPRRFPLYIDTPLVESTVFRVHLPEGVRVIVPASDLHLDGPFGAYSVEFRQRSAGEIEVRRAFRIPVQVVPADRFDAFARFARQIDEAERQRLTVSR